MKYIGLFLLLVTAVACKEDYEYPLGGGNPTFKIQEVPTVAHFGDSIPFLVDVTDEGTALSTLKVQLLFSGDLVSETVIRTKDYGSYRGKIFVPFYRDIPNGAAQLKFVLENVGMVKSETEQDLSLSRPDFPYLDLIAGEESYRMERVEEYQYALTGTLPQKLNAYLQAPAVGEWGNIINFGWEDSGVQEGSTQLIPFSYLDSDVYTVEFNTLTYQANPFQSYEINGVAMWMETDTRYVAELSFGEGEEISVTGLPDVENWWIDMDFLREENNSLFFNAAAGKYRITADIEHTYFIVEPMDGDALAELKADGTGTIWIIGEGVGKPGLNNEVGWTTEKALALAPIGDKRYQITLIAGQSVSQDNINFKFFHQKDWGGEFGSEHLSTDSDLIFVGDGDNGRDNGNLGVVEGKQLEAAKAYILTVDLSGGNDQAMLSVEER